MLKSYAQHKVLYTYYVRIPVKDYILNCGCVNAYF
jgi:hypothetical protein